MKRGIVHVVLHCLVWGLLTVGCADVARVGTTVGEQVGALTKEQKDIIDRRALEMEEASRPMAEKEEYYVGRAVAANILNRYKLYHDDRLNTYVNQIGQSLVLASDVPLTYGGYHFAVLDSEEANALSCPGGLIFITWGMLKKAKNEEEMAAILAHEVAHVNHRDGIASISQARWAQVAASLGKDAAKEWGGADLSKLTSLFAGSVDDVVKTLIVNGYGRDQELIADSSAMIFMRRLGYDPTSLADLLGRMAKEQTGSKGRGIFATHPGMAERLGAVRSTIAGNGWKKIDHKIRDRRFEQYF